MVKIQIELPDDTAAAAQEAGLLTSESMLQPDLNCTITRVRPLVPLSARSFSFLSSLGWSVALRPL